MKYEDQLESFRLGKVATDLRIQSIKLSDKIAGFSKKIADAQDGISGANWPTDTTDQIKHLERQADDLETRRVMLIAQKQLADINAKLTATHATIVGLGK